MPDSLPVAAALEGRFVTEREIGSGGMAVVCLARDRALERAHRLGLDEALEIARHAAGAPTGDRAPVRTLNASRDMRRVVANGRDYRADAWMSNVIP